MKQINTSTLLQVIALLFLLIIGYMTFKSNDNWRVMKTELEKVNKELKIAEDTLAKTKQFLQKSQLAFKQLKAQKDLVTHQRDSILLNFKKKNAKDWRALQRIKDSIAITNNKLLEDRIKVGALFGLNK